MSTTKVRVVGWLAAAALALLVLVGAGIGIGVRALWLARLPNGDEPIRVASADDDHAQTGTGSKQKSDAPAPGDGGSDPPLLKASEPKSDGASTFAPTMSPEIRDAIRRGAEFLQTQMRDPGRIAGADSAGRFADQVPTGRAALVGLTLLEARVPPDDPAVQQALDAVRKGGPRLHMVYAIGAAVFFLNRLHDATPLSERDRVLLRSLALRLIAGQLADGRWAYNNPPIQKTAEDDLLARLRSKQFKPHGTAPQAWRASNSMTQFALLALWGSRRHDVPVDRAVLACAARMRELQYPEGTWDYAVGHPEGKICKDSNTCAGLIALAMEKTLRAEARLVDPAGDARTDDQCAKAFAHLAKVIGRTAADAGPPAHRYRGKIIRADAWGDYYFLWCLERVGVIYDRAKIGNKDWYEWGAKVILDHQQPDGSWLDRHEAVCDTCFALLFLTRANLAPDLTQRMHFIIRQQHR